jgi:hypothetical protein
LTFCGLSLLAAAMADLVNWALVIGTDVGVLYFLGFKSLVYLLAGSLLGGGLHPMAGHLIAGVVLACWQPGWLAGWLCHCTRQQGAAIAVVSRVCGWCRRTIFHPFEC